MKNGMARLSALTEAAVAGLLGAPMSHNETLAAAAYMVADDNAFFDYEEGGESAKEAKAAIKARDWGEVYAISDRLIGNTVESDHNYESLIRKIRDLAQAWERGQQANHPYLSHWRNLK